MFLVFDVIMLIRDRIIRQRGKRGEIGFARFRVDASVSSLFNAQRNVEFSNFVPRAREMHNRSHAASAAFSDSSGFSDIV